MGSFVYIHTTTPNDAQSPVHQRQIYAPLDTTRRRPQALHLRIVLRQRLAMVVQHLADVVDALLRETHVAQSVAQHLVTDAAAWRSQVQLHGVQHGGEQFVEVVGHVARVRQLGQRKIEHFRRALATLNVVYGHWMGGVGMDEEAVRSEYCCTLRGAYLGSERAAPAWTAAECTWRTFSAPWTGCT